MNRERGRNSRFGPPVNAGNARMSNFAASNLPPNRTPQKTPQQIAFDLEFKKWEESFEQWKKSFANHPDRNAYRQYEQKFLDVRDKLIAKRKQIYNNERPSAPPSSPFENQLSAADAMANSILSKFDEPRGGRGGGRGAGPPSGYNNRMNDNYRGGGGGRGGNGGYNNNRMDDGYRGGGGYQDNQMMDFQGSRDRSRSSGSGNYGYDMGRGGSMMDRGGNMMARGGGDMRGRGGGRRGGMMNQGRGGGGNFNSFDRRGGGRGGGGGGEFGGQNDRFGPRGPRSALPKPNHDQIEKELNRQDVYPFNKWYLCGDADRPQLVGKRAKKKNAKILNVIEFKRKVANGEIPLEELPFGLRIEKLFELAKETECPNRLPGSSSRKLKTLRAKNPTSLTPDERKFLAFADYVIAKRGKYFEKKKLEEAENQGEGGAQSMDGVEVAAAANDSAE